MQGWQRNNPLQPEYQEYQDRWSTPEFSEYVRDLCKQADEVCEKCTEVRRLFLVGFV